jgi:hypothetical protein
MGAQGAERPIFIVGISRRSGTNFLASVLLCHRDCAAPAPPVAEDHLLRDATLLERYARRTARRWPRRWGDREQGEAALFQSLGTGLVAFLTSRTDGVRTVTRTPHTDNLHLVPRLLADADLILLVRDGRSVTASLVHAWRWSHDQAVKEWRKGARDILRFQRASAAGGGRCLIIRYEDLVRDFGSAVDVLLEFTGLDPDGFDHDKARELPILGSSYIRDPEGKITWKPISRIADFDPADRYASWSSAQHERFNWLAGDEQLALGYPLDRGDGTRRARVVRNVARDVGTPIRDRPVIAARGVLTWLRAQRADRRALGHQSLGSTSSPAIATTRSRNSSLWWWRRHRS